MRNTQYTGWMHNRHAWLRTHNNNIIQNQESLLLHMEAGILLIVFKMKGFAVFSEIRNMSLG